MNNNAQNINFDIVNIPMENFFCKIDKIINPEKYIQIVRHWEFKCNNVKQILNKINDRVSKIFENQKVAHKDVYSLLNEVENGIPTILECKAYEELTIKYRDIFYFIINS